MHGLMLLAGVAAALSYGDTVPPEEPEPRPMPPVFPQPPQKLEPHAIEAWRSELVDALLNPPNGAPRIQGVNEDNVRLIADSVVSRYLLQRGVDAARPKSPAELKAEAKRARKAARLQAVAAR